MVMLHGVILCLVLLGNTIYNMILCLAIGDGRAASGVSWGSSLWNLVARLHR